MSGKLDYFFKIVWKLNDMFSVTLYLYLRVEQKFYCFRKWAESCVCADKRLTEDHWDCENNKCNDCLLENIYWQREDDVSQFETEWKFKVPCEDDDGEFSIPFSYYVKSKVIDPTSGKSRDQYEWTTDFVSLEIFLNKYHSTIFE